MRHLAPRLSAATVRAAGIRGADDWRDMRTETQPELPALGRSRPEYVDSHASRRADEQCPGQSVTAAVINEVHSCGYLDDKDCRDEPVDSGAERRPPPGVGH